MIVIKGNIRKGRMIDGIQSIHVDFSVDEICRGNTPYTNIYTFCLLNGLLRLDEERKVYLPTIDLVDLELSEDEEKNEYVKEMFRKMEVPFY